MEATDNTGEQRTALAMPESEVYPSQWRPPGNSGDPSIPPGVVVCFKCDTMIRGGDHTLIYQDRLCHFGPKDCLASLKRELNEAKKELEEARAGSVFGSYNTLSNESALMSGPRFIDLVREMLRSFAFSVGSSSTARILDMAYTLVHGGLRFEPDERHSAVKYSREYDLAYEFIDWAVKGGTKPRWLRGVF